MALCHCPDNFLEKAMNRWLAFAVVAVFGLVFTGCGRHHHHRHITVVEDSGSGGSGGGGHESGCSCHNCGKGKAKGKGHTKNADKPGHRKHGD